jgi:excisionase family DNA binding protein
MPSLSGLLLSGELAEHFRAHPETIRRKLRERRIQGIKVGRCWRVPLSEIERIEKEGGL